MPDNNRIKHPRFMLFKDSQARGMRVGCSSAEKAATKLGAAGGIAGKLETLDFGQSLECGEGVKVMRIDDSEVTVIDPVKEARSGRFFKKDSNGGD